MPFEIVLPLDTQNEIEEFIVDHYVGLASQLAAAGAIDDETEKLAANPTLGTVPIGTPFETRRIHRFTIAVGDKTRVVELLYFLNNRAQRIVFQVSASFRHLRFKGPKRHTRPDAQTSAQAPHPTGGCERAGFPCRARSDTRAEATSAAAEAASPEVSYPSLAGSGDPDASRALAALASVRLPISR